MIAVVDYDTGNLRSVADALHRAGAEFILTADPALLRRASQSSDLLVRRMPQSLYQRWLVDARFSDCRICVPELPVGTISAEWNGMTLERCENLRQAIAYETP